jgi:hypothetical protein
MPVVISGHLGVGIIWVDALLRDADPFLLLVQPVNSTNNEEEELWCFKLRRRSQVIVTSADKGL